jgi:hypothetical protein
MPNGYTIWVKQVRDVLNSINMEMDDWQRRWPFDFQSEYDIGTNAEDAAMKANRFWWFNQNKSLKRECTSTPKCWLPRDHQQPCEPLNRDGWASPQQPVYQHGDYVKVEFPDQTTGIGEWMWVRVTRCDYEKKLIFGILDSEPLNAYEGRLGLGTEVAVHFSQIRDHKNPTEFIRQ